MVLAEVNVNSFCRVMMSKDAALNDKMLVDNLDHVEEERGKAWPAFRITSNWRCYTTTSESTIRALTLETSS